MATEVARKVAMKVASAQNGRVCVRRKGIALATILIFFDVYVMRKDELKR